MSGSPLSRLVRASMLASLAIVLLALVVVSAGGYRFGGAGSGNASPHAVDTVLTIVIAVYALGALALVAGAFWAGFEQRRNPKAAPARGRRAWGIFLALALLAIVVASLTRFHLRIDVSRLHPPPHAAPPAASVPNAKVKSKGAPPRRHAPRFELIPFLAVLLAAGGGVGALVIAERRRRGRLPRAPLERDDLVLALDETLDDLRQEGDPRRAVIAAYARMERVLASHGIPRRRFEAPNEYLARVLADLTRQSRAAERLTALFERARFSPHEIPSSMKDDAIAAVEKLQAELAAAELERAA
jgi:hypothetical protein